MRARPGLAAIWLSTGVLGCADARDVEQPAANAAAIVDGAASGAEQDGVVLLRAELAKGEILCTASLVAPNLLVTARHCVSYLTDGVFNCSVQGEAIDNPEGGGRLGLHLPAESLEVYSGAPPRSTPMAHGREIISTLSPTICKNDLAFVVLDTELDAPLVPMRLERPALIGETAVMVGYGMSELDESIDYQRQKRAQKRDLVVAGVGPDSVADGVTTVAPRSLLLKGPSGCIGDSGGPLLAQGTGALLGVYSLLEGESCQASSAKHHLVHVPAFTSLIEQAFTAAGQEPTLESATLAGAGGAAGSADEPTSNGSASSSGGAAGAEAVEEPASEPSAPHESGGCALARAPRSPSAPWGLLAVALLLSAARRADRRRLWAAWGRARGREPARPRARVS